MTTTAEAQALVARAVAERGYRQGWNDQQFAARQIVKLVEEVGELEDEGLLACLPGYYNSPLGKLSWNMRDAAAYAREAFDKRSCWKGVEIAADAARAELADIAVVVLTLADALGYDVIQAAIDKAAADVTRGVRQP